MASRPPAAVDTTADVAVDASSGESARREGRRGPAVPSPPRSAPPPPPSAAPAAPSAARETDPRRLEQRQKQIDFGKNTRGYARYVAAVPR